MMNATPAPIHHHQPIPAIVRATADHGWPHTPTLPERIAVARLMLATYAPRGGSDVCRFRTPFGRGWCSVTRATPAGTPTFRVSWRAWEDGSAVSWRQLR
jgi:hypothetical protein